jgi:hypothetical protein
LIPHRQMQGTCQFHWLPEFNFFRKRTNRWSRDRAFKQMKLENAL